MSPFHVNYQNRLVAVSAALEEARRDNRLDDAVALELAVRVLHMHVNELQQRVELASV